MHLFSADFETTTNPNDCRVWQWGVYKLENNKFTWGKDIKSYFDFISTYKKSIQYFHNLAFDGRFLLSYILENNLDYNTLISDNGVWYMIEVTHPNGNETIFYDSYKKLPYGVSDLAKAFDLPMSKGEIDYKKDRPVGYEPTENEIDYLLNDVRIVGESLKIQFKQDLKRMTIGSDALNSFKEMVGKNRYRYVFPFLELSEDDYIRSAYRGGFCWVNPKIKGKDNGFTKVYDVNSLYPSVMYHKMLPYGIPIFFKGKYEYDVFYPLSIQRIEASFKVKPNMIPTIQLKNTGRFLDKEYIEDTEGEIYELYLTNVDLELFQKHYDIDFIRYIDGYKFKAKDTLFRDYINKWTHVKMNSTGAIRSIAKLMLNSLYGKFASGTVNRQKHPYLDSDGIVKYYVGQDEIKEPEYTAVAVFTTAYAREITISSAQNNYDTIAYCDTDSIHLLTDKEPDIKIHPKKLGYWAHEGDFIKSRFLKQKSYIEMSKDGSIDVKCAGMNKKMKEYVTWENFQVGYSTQGSLKPKAVKGGVYLKDYDFTLK